MTLITFTTKTDGISEAKDTTGTGNFDKDGFTQHAIQALVGINVSGESEAVPYYRFSQFKGDCDDGGICRCAKQLHGIFAK